MNRQEPIFKVGASVGGVFGTTSEAVDGFHDSEFEDGTLVGVHAGYVFPTWGGGPSPVFETRFAGELRVESYDMLLSENSFDFGTLDITSTVLAFKFMQVPVDYNILGFHFDLGLGWGGTRFSKDSMLEADELAYGYYTEIDVGVAGIFTLGGGLDVYMAPDACLSADIRYAEVAAPVDWYEDGILRPEIDWFNASNTQFLISFTFFF